MAVITKLSRLIGGVQRDVDLSANTLKVSVLLATSKIQIGPEGSATDLTQTQLDTLLAHTHASGSDNQDVIAGAGLTGGGSGASPSLAVGAGDGISVNADDVAVDATVLRTNVSKSMTSGTNLTFSGSGEVLGLPATPSVDGAAASKKYVNDQDALKVSKAGDTMTGDLTLAGAPSVDLHAATKKYVDDADATKANTTAVVLRDGTNSMSADLNLNNHKVTNLTDGSAAGDAVNKGQLDTKADDSVVIKKGGTVAFTADQSMGGFKLTNVGTPTQAGDAVTKAYADGIAAGFDAHASVAVATSGANLVVTASGTKTGKTLTADANGAFVLDGRTGILGDRILVKDQTNPIDNGVYTLTDAGNSSNPYILTRSSDMDGSPSIEVAGGDTVFVTNGLVNGGTSWSILAVGAIDVDVDDFNWTQTAGIADIQAGNGLTKTGNVLDVNVDSSTIEIDSDILRVKDAGITAAKIASSAVGNGLTGGSGTVISVSTDGQGLEVGTGSLAIELDGTTLSKSATGLKVNSIANAQIASGAAIDINKLASGTAADVIVANASGVPTYVAVTGDVTISNAGVTAIGAAKVTNDMLAGSIADSKLSQIVTADKVAGSAVQLKASAGLKNDTGLAIEPADIAGNGLEDNGSDKLQIKLAANSGLTVGAGGLAVVGGSTISFVAGQSFSANITSLVRFAMTGETAGRLYKADNDATSSDNFYVVGLVQPASAASAGDSIVMTTSGSLTLGSGDTNFAAGDIGKAVYLSSSGGFTVTAPTVASTAVVQVGMVQEVNKIWVQHIRVMGVNG